MANEATGESIVLITVGPHPIPASPLYHQLQRLAPVGNASAVNGHRRHYQASALARLDAVYAPLGKVVDTVVPTVGAGTPRTSDHHKTLTRQCGNGIDDRRELEMQLDGISPLKVQPLAQFADDRRTADAPGQYLDLLGMQLECTSKHDQ